MNLAQSFIVAEQSWTVDLIINIVLSSYFFLRILLLWPPLPLTYSRSSPRWYHLCFLHWDVGDSILLLNEVNLDMWSLKIFKENKVFFGHMCCLSPEIYFSHVVHILSTSIYSRVTFGPCWAYREGHSLLMLHIVLFGSPNFVLLMRF